jgi:hypothetical protein
MDDRRTAGDTAGQSPLATAVTATSHPCLRHSHSSAFQEPQPLRLELTVNFAPADREPPRRVTPGLRVTGQPR